MTKPDFKAFGIDINRHLGGEVFIQEHSIPAGRVLGQHAHGHDHLSYVVSGKVEVTIEDETTVYEAPCCLLVPAHKKHMVRSLTDAVWLCIWSTDYMTGDQA